VKGRRIWGYCRVSTKQQNYEYQERILKDTGLDFTLIFNDKQSGKDFTREQYSTMINNLKEGDLVVFTSLDRMGRNYNEVIDQWNLITKTKKCDIIICDMDLLDTTKSSDTLTSQFISDIVLQILSYVADTERAKIQKRVKQGLENRRLKGLPLGRTPKEVDMSFFAELYDKWIHKKIKQADMMEQLNISRTKLYNLIKVYQQND